MEGGFVHITTILRVEIETYWGRLTLGVDWLQDLWLLIICLGDKCKAFLRKDFFVDIVSHWFVYELSGLNSIYLLD